VIGNWCCRKRIRAHRKKLVCGLPFRNKVHAGKTRLIGGPKARIWPQCCLTTPYGPLALIAVNGQKPEVAGQNSDQK
jgi:hypothetical protein